MQELGVEGAAAAKERDDRRDGRDGVELRAGEFRERVKIEAVY